MFWHNINIFYSVTAGGEGRAKETKLLFYANE